MRAFVCADIDIETVAASNAATCIDDHRLDGASGWIGKFDAITALLDKIDKPCSSGAGRTRNPDAANSANPRQPVVA